jgi:hypothetical protein
VSVTTVPFIDVFQMSTGDYEFECELCHWAILREYFPDGEETAGDHLAECHPRRLNRAHEQRIVEYYSYKYGLMHDPEDGQIAY